MTPSNCFCCFPKYCWWYFWGVVQFNDGCPLSRKELVVHTVNIGYCYLNIPDVSIMITKWPLGSTIVVLFGYEMFLFTNIAPLFLELYDAKIWSIHWVLSVVLNVLMLCDVFPAEETGVHSSNIIQMFQLMNLRDDEFWVIWRVNVDYGSYYPLVSGHQPPPECQQD